MKHVLVAVFVVLTSVNSSKAQIPPELIEVAWKIVWTKYQNNKAIEQKISEIKPTYEAWIKSLKDYYSKTGEVGDCDAIKFRQLPNNRGQTENFFYECGVEENGDVAFLRVKSRDKIGDCPKEATFGAAFDIKKNYLEVFSLPAKDACIFFIGPNLNQEQKTTLKEGFMYGSAGGVGTSARGTLKAPNANDIDMGSGASRSKADIMAVVNARMPGLRRTYHQYLKTNPNLAGKVTLKFTIAPSGDITSISMVSSTTGNAKFDAAIKDAVLTWKWKAINSGNTTPTIPFNFTDESNSERQKIELKATPNAIGTSPKGTIKAPRENEIDIDSKNAPRSKAEIMEVVNAHWPSLSSIYYDKYLKLKPDLKGNVVLKLNIDSNGVIASIDIVSSTTNYFEFDNAVKSQVATWKWKAKAIKKQSGKSPAEILAGLLPTILTIPFNFTEQ